MTIGTLLNILAAKLGIIESFLTVLTPLQKARWRQCKVLSNIVCDVITFKYKVVWQPFRVIGEKMVAIGLKPDTFLVL